MHIYSPRIEMYRQMAADRGVQCSTSVEIDGELVCSIEKLKNILKQIIVSLKLIAYIHYFYTEKIDFYRLKVQKLLVKRIILIIIILLLKIKVTLQFCMVN